MIHTRRGFIGALGAVIAAPAIVRVANIMPVRALLNQCGQTLVVDPISGRLAAGDIITIEGVRAIDRLLKQPCDYLRQFVVTAELEKGATLIPLYPPIIGPGDRYQTVDRLPPRKARIQITARAYDPIPRSTQRLAATV